MRCPYCMTDEVRVVDSRTADGGRAVRRRRECIGCRVRFSTYERPETGGLAVRKRGGQTEPFDVEKLHAGIMRATAGAEASTEAVRAATEGVERRVRGLGRTEVTADEIGTYALEAVQALDPVAGIRFASVYKSFTSPSDFEQEAAALGTTAPEASAAPQPPAGADTDGGY